MDAPWPGDHPRSTKGRELQDALAGQLRVAKERHIVWTELTLPGGGRADVFAFRPWGSFRDQTVYEVKVSRADFWNDVNEGKYRKYLPSCHRLFFAVPAGLVKKSEIPEGCGLITRQPHGGFRVIVPAPRREIEDPPYEWLWGLLDRTWFEDTRIVRDLRERVTFEKNGEIRPQTWLWGKGAGQRVREAEQLIESGSMTVEARNAMYLADRIVTLAKEAGIKGQWRGDHVDERALSHLAESAVKLLQAADRVQVIGRYLAHLDPYNARQVDSRVLGVEPPGVADDDELL